MNKSELSKQIKDYVREHSPNGLAKLAIKSGISISTLEKMRAGSYYPKKPGTVAKLKAVLNEYNLAS